MTFPTGEELLDLLDGLRRDGFPIGIKEYIAAQEISLGCGDAKGVDRQRLCHRLAPVLCTNPDEQRLFYQRYTEWWAQRQPVSSSPRRPSPRVTELDREVRKTGPWKWVVLASLLIVTWLVITLLWMESDTKVAQETTTQETRAPSTPGGRPIAPGTDTGQAAVSPGTTLDPLSFLLEHRQLTRLTLAFSPLIVLMIWMLWRRSRRQLILERRSVHKVNALADINLPEPQHSLYRDEAFVRARIEARRHQATETTELDADATVAATVDQLGWFTPVYRRRLRLPAYLALVDRSGFRDQQARLIDEFIDRLVDGGVTVDRYYFDRDPRLCRSALPGIASRSTLRELAGRYPQHRLLMFSDGAGLLDAVTGQPALWNEIFNAWSERALMTPVPVFHWSSRELELAGQGYRVLPVTAEGLRSFVEHLATPERAYQPAESFRAPFPELISANPERWLQRDQPKAEECNRLLHQLRHYLGEDGFRWLCALAVYPELNWHLTLYLGLQFHSSTGAPLLDETLLLNMVRLPWLRQGSMPDWLRQLLVAELSVTDETRVRGFLRELLRSRLETGDSRFHLDIAQPDERIQQPGWTRLFTDLLRTEPEGSQLQDRVFVSFLVGKQSSGLQLQAPGNWHRWVYERGLSALGWQDRSAILLALLTSLSFIACSYPLFNLMDRQRADGGEPLVIAGDEQKALVLPKVEKLFVEPYGGGSGNRFSVRNLSLNGAGNVIRLPQGGTVKATLEINHDCPSCGGAINQIIVGLAGEERAQACIWSGGQSSRGWQTKAFNLTIPKTPGRYDIRTRYAQAYKCEDALGWWKVDRSNGPGQASTIGAVLVSPALPSYPEMH